MANASRQDREPWDEFMGDREGVAFESEQVIADLGVASLIDEAERELPSALEGRERLAVLRTRVNQSQFRRMVLARYEAKCCVTGLDVPELLVAAHIVPWAEDASQRMNPMNGLCLNALHDRAFEAGIFVVDEDLRVCVTGRERYLQNDTAREWLAEFDGRALLVRDDFAPDPALLRRHRERFAA